MVEKGARPRLYSIRGLMGGGGGITKRYHGKAEYQVQHRIVVFVPGPPQIVKRKKVDEHNMRTTSSRKPCLGYSSWKEGEGWGPFQGRVFCRR